MTCSQKRTLNVIEFESYNMPVSSFCLGTIYDPYSFLNYQFLHYLATQVSYNYVPENRHMCNICTIHKE